MPKFPPPDPNESPWVQPGEDTPLRAPTAVFVAGPPSLQADRASDALLDLRPGLLIVIDSA
jgi:hypothetical protein